MNIHREADVLHQLTRVRDLVLALRHLCRDASHDVGLDESAQDYHDCAEKHLTTCLRIYVVAEDQEDALVEHYVVFAK